jgi:hypothetical protein
MAILLFGTASCSTSTAGSSVATNTSVTTAGSSTSDNAPKVAVPVDITKLPKACELLTSADLAKYAVSNPVPGSNQCDWSSQASGSATGAQYFLHNGGINTVYKKKAAGELALFKPIEAIQGYPAVIFLQVDKQKAGECGVAVGITDDSTLAVSVALGSTSKSYADPCPAAVKVTTSVMTNLLKQVS